ncbi:DUF4179 domain-containing protein [Sinanaerobacter chloroacetimidivorans]|nr:DUF4179 domain-containing protein [Sinanaerobacter chloroacetimidivorans]
MENNREDWEEFLAESSQYPEGLSEVENRIGKRIGKHTRKRRVFYSTLSAVAAVFIFVILVNTSTAVAGSISEIPLIGKLAVFVKFDKSLSNAIENDYVQKVDLSAWDGQEQLLLPYVIADERNLVLFFQLPEELKLEADEWVQINLLEMRDGVSGERIAGFSCITSSLSAEGRNENNGFIQQSYHFSEGTLPEFVELSVNLEAEVPGDSPIGESMGAPSEMESKQSSKKIGTFTFQLHFGEFAEPMVHELHKDYIIEGQSLTVEEMKVYPTGTEVSFTFPEENTAWIKGLELSVEKDREIFLKGNNGLSATSDDIHMSVFIESDYFDPPGSRTLLIQAIRLLDKQEEYVTVDINHKTITPAIHGSMLTEVTKKQGTASLTFTTRVSEDDNFGMFSPEYQDEEGNVYDLQEMGFSNIDSFMETRVVLTPPDNGKVILQRTLTPKIVLEKPIRIDLPVQPKIDS